MLYIHFGTKGKLFEAAVHRNAHERLAGLQERFSSIPNVPPVECVERMAEATILACVEGENNAAVMAWALMEMPDFGADVYRFEIGSTSAMWDAEIAKRFAGSPVRTRLTIHLAPYAVHACMAFGYWLAALRHQRATAVAHARQYAGGLADATRTVLGWPAGSSVEDIYGVRSEPALIG
jgi:AcrR family transcriptional regulator